MRSVQSSYVKKAVAEISAAIEDVNAAINYARSHPNGVSSVAPAPRPNFAAPARPAPERNIGLEMALNDLKNAFDALASVDGGDLGGLRAKANGDIAAAASDVIAGITAANAAFPSRGQNAPPPQMSAPVAVLPLAVPGTFRFVAQHSGKCLDAAGPADTSVRLVPASQQACSGAASQEWRFKPVAGGYEIVSSLDSSRCLLLRDATTIPGRRVFLSTCSKTGRAGEIWNRETVGQNDRLIATHSKECMDVSEVSTADGAAILQYDCSGGRNQLWALQATAQ